MDREGRELQRAFSCLKANQTSTVSQSSSDGTTACFRCSHYLLSWRKWVHKTVQCTKLKRWPLTSPAGRSCMKARLMICVGSSRCSHFAAGLVAGQDFENKDDK
ncbi:hypothetical protein Y1Q_0018991 [Alligator mississippiensis]|uniref:Uncharacterized protein n=1 Tax=Alligator mississippiensis TaxID=8496 RepID=A0A151M3G7_ALLMI|nr:hypothetical protein Y1Q_0018991 [Alligator mississippiensis]